MAVQQDRHEQRYEQQSPFWEDKICRVLWLTAGQDAQTVDGHPGKLALEASIVRILASDATLTNQIIEAESARSRLARTIHRLLGMRRPFLWRMLRDNDKRET